MTPRETAVRVGTVAEALSLCRELAHLLRLVGCHCAPGRLCNLHRALEMIDGKLSFLLRERQEAKA